MFDFELEQILRGCHITRPFFLGVFSPKDLRGFKPKKTRYCLVLGTTNSFRVIGHWVAIYADGKDVYIFCSYGTHPHHLPGMQTFLQGFDHIYFNQKTHQNLISTVCGGYCCYVLYNLCLGNSFVKILKGFDRIKNDDLFIKRFMCRQFGFRFE